MESIKKELEIPQADTIREKTSQNQIEKIKSLIEKPIASVVNKDGSYETSVYVLFELQDNVKALLESKGYEITVRVKDTVDGIEQLTGFYITKISWQNKV